MTGKERLLVLADYLDRLQTPLDMVTWFNDCGTAACAAGHACTIPKLRAEGLYARFGCMGWVPYFKGSIQFQALADFFEISHAVAHRIFSTEGYESGSDVDIYIDPLVVSARIREVCGARHAP